MQSEAALLSTWCSGIVGGGASLCPREQRRLLSVLHKWLILVLSWSLIPLKGHLWGIFFSFSSEYILLSWTLQRFLGHLWKHQGGLDCVGQEKSVRSYSSRTPVTVGHLWFFWILMCGTTMLLPLAGKFPDIHRCHFLILTKMVSMSSWLLNHLLRIFFFGINFIWFKDTALQDEVIIFHSFSVCQCISKCYLLTWDSMQPERGSPVALSVSGSPLCTELLTVHPWPRVWGLLCVC